MLECRRRLEVLPHRPGPARRSSAASRSRSPPAAASRSPASRAAARARSSTSSPASTPSTPARIRVAGADVTALGDAGRAALRRRADRPRLPAVQPDPEPRRRRQPRLPGPPRRPPRPRLAGRAHRAASASTRSSPATPSSSPAASSSASPSAGRWPRRPGLILADEPTGNLDEATGDAVMALLLELVAATGASLLLVTHSPRLAARADARATLHAGRARMTAVLAALLGHWRRHPVELATLLVGLAVATALWSGVQALNAEARASYARAAALLGGDRARRRRRRPTASASRSPTTSRSAAPAGRSRRSSKATSAAATTASASSASTR